MKLEIFSLNQLLNLYPTQSPIAPPIPLNKTEVYENESTPNNVGRYPPIIEPRNMQKYIIFEDIS